ncbi:MAG: biotin transporter BioY [Clostridia bacterium]|nr:biotin transporter BioY [Clostridia bacterium]
MEKKTKGFQTKDLAYVAVCAVLMAVCSWISIPAAVPFTLQTFAVFCSLGFLGGRRGTAAILVYLLLGALGVPVFAGFSGGIGILFGATGGYLLGFILMGLVYWLGEQLSRDGRGVRGVRIVSMILGLLLCYAFGTAWFMFVYARQSGAIALGTALAWCVIPFLLPDLVKLALALQLSGRLRKVLHL